MVATPSPWPIAPLGELCRIELGSTPPRKSGAMWDAEKVTNNVWLTIADLPTSLHASAIDSKEYVSDIAADNMRRIPVGTLLVSFKLTLGRLAYSGRELFSNEAIASLLDIDGSRILKRFLYWALCAFDWDKAAEGDQKIKGKTLNKAKLKRIPIPLPPLEEQRRIVAVLDAAFDDLDRARTHVETNAHNARELLSVAIENAIQGAGGKPVTLAKLMEDGWVLGHLDGNHGSNYPRKSEFVSEGVPYISANCISRNVINMSRCKFLTPERAAVLRKGVAQDRDVIFAHNATVGPVALLSTSETRVILSTSLTYYRCNEERLRPEFLVYEMRSAGFRQQYEEVMEQATRNQVPITMQRKFCHLIPSMDDQLRIAELGMKLEQDTLELEDTYQRALIDLDDLRQALLQRAFAGELT